MENQTIGGYEILERIGAGAMSRVYLARPLKLPEKRVAIKVLEPALALDQDAVARFRREAHAASFLQHGNVVSIIDFGSDNGVHYLVMEFVPGRDLRQVLDASAEATPGTGLPVGLVIYLVEEMAYGLRSAHERGIIHRDIKATNVLLGQAGEVKVVDFGLARSFDHELSTALQDATIDGTFLGTASYASPEQADRQSDLDARTDVFSLGVLAFELLTGRKPFSGRDFDSLLHGIRHDPHPPLGESGCRTVYRELETLIDGMLAKQRDHRLAGMDELLQALQACRQGLDRLGIRLANRREHLTRLAADPGGYCARLHAEAAAAVGEPGPAADGPPAWETAVAPPEPPPPPAASATRPPDAPADAPAESPAETPAETPAAPAGPSGAPDGAPDGGEPEAARPGDGGAPPPEPPDAAPPPSGRGRGRRLATLAAGGVVIVGLALLAIRLVPGLLAPDSAPAPVGATGWLEVRAEPAGTTLYFRRSTGDADGDPVQNVETRVRTLAATPTVLALEAGNWLGTASHPGRASQTRTWHVAEAETTRLELLLSRAGERASLSVVTSPPGARVTIDGQVQDARTPHTYHGLAPGRREVRLEIEDGSSEIALTSVTRTVTLDAGAAGRLIVDLRSP